MIAKFDCRVFCHINSLVDKISNTAATYNQILLVLGKLYNSIIGVATFFFLEPGVKLDEKSIENGLEVQKFFWLCVFSG